MLPTGASRTRKAGSVQALYNRGHSESTREPLENLYNHARLGRFDDDTLTQQDRIAVDVGLTRRVGNRHGTIPIGDRAGGEPPVELARQATLDLLGHLPEIQRVHDPVDC